MMPSGAQAPPEHPGAIPMPPNSSASLDAEDPNADGRKAKRELSQSKRAAQNRAAQVWLMQLFTTWEQLCDGCAADATFVGNQWTWDLLTSVSSIASIPSTQGRLYQETGATGPRVWRTGATLQKLRIRKLRPEGVHRSPAGSTHRCSG